MVKLSFLFNQSIGHRVTLRLRGKYREKTPGKLLPDVQRILSEEPSGSGSKAIDV